MKIILLVTLSLISLQAISQVDQAKQDWADLKKYAMENKNLKPLQKGKKRIVFMGDSITEFWKLNDSNFFSNDIYIDRGISGQTTSQMLFRFQADVIALKPAAVVILAGINDIAENNGPISLEDVFANITSMVRLARANGIKVILSSVLPANHFYWRTYLQPAEKVIKLNTMIEAYCKKNNLTYVDYYTHMVDANKGLDKKYADDGVHPTLAGYKVMEPLVEKAIAKTLKQKN